MSELIRERVKSSEGKSVKIFLNNGWRYARKITGSDKDFVEILDRKTSAYKIIRFSDIKDCEVEE